MEQVIKTTKKLDEDKELKLEFSEWEPDDVWEPMKEKLEFSENSMLNGYQEVEIQEEEEEEEEDDDDDVQEWEPIKDFF